MNKKLITLAVAAAMAAPLGAVAETTLYGSVRASVVSNNFDTKTYTTNAAGVTTVATAADTTRGWDVQDQSSRIGVKGSEDLGDGLKAIFQLEWNFVDGLEGGSTSGGGLNNRLAYAGLQGNWGTVALGRQWTPYYGAVNVADIYNMADVNIQYLGTTRTGNALAYLSPNFNGFSGGLVAVIDAVGNTATTSRNRGVDSWNLGINYDNGPIHLGFGYLDTKKAGINGAPGTELGKYQMTGIGGSYVFQDMIKLLGQFETGKLPVGTAGGDIKASEWTLGGEGYWGNHVVRVTYSDYGKDLPVDNLWAFGWQYNFSKRTRVYAEYYNGEAVPGRALVGTDTVYTVADGNEFGLGIRHDF